MALYRDGKALLGSDPSSGDAQALVARWRALIDAETGGDEEAKADVLEAFKRRHGWAAGMKAYVASLHEMDVKTWERVAAFIERARTVEAR